MMKVNIIIAVVAAWLQTEANGHGMMVEPPNRSSRWRTDPSAPINYNDNELFCGGLSVQWNTNNGKCGICGDSYGESRPRPNELGGFYGEGVIVQEYSSASVISVTIKLTQNHKGYFTFSLCDMERSPFGEEEDCFKQILLADGTDKAYIISEYGNGNFTYELRLPEGLKSTHGVLRWQYRAGNNWGVDEDGTACLGCGPQETYRTCADIRII